MKKLYRKIIRKIFGKCRIDGHNWKLRKGWKLNHDDAPRKTGDPFVRLTKPWIYYECSRCPATAEREKMPNI